MQEAEDLIEEIIALREHCHTLHDENAALKDQITRLEGMLAEFQAKVKYTLPNLVELPVGNTTITRS